MMQKKKKKKAHYLETSQAGIAQTQRLPSGSRAWKIDLLPLSKCPLASSPYVAAPRRQSIE